MHLKSIICLRWGKHLVTKPLMVALLFSLDVSLRFVDSWLCVITIRAVILIQKNLDEYFRAIKIVGNSCLTIAEAVSCRTIFHPVLEQTAKQMFAEEQCPSFFGFYAAAQLATF